MRILFLLCLSFACIADETSYLKNFAFSICMAYSHSAITEDAIATAGAYVNIGSSSINIYQELEILAQEASSQDYPSKNGYNLAIMKCLDFYNSQALETTIKKLLK